MKNNFPKTAKTDIDNFIGFDLKSLESKQVSRFEFNLLNQIAVNDLSMLRFCFKLLIYC